MTLKTPLTALSFVLATTLSSYGMAQQLGAGVSADARVGTRDVQPGSAASAAGPATLPADSAGQSAAGAGATGAADGHATQKDKTGDKKAKKSKQDKSAVSGDSGTGTDAASRTNSKIGG